MAVDELLEKSDARDRQRAKWIGVYIAVLAVLLAICNMGGGNASKDAAKANLDATNLWAFFQAKNLRRTHYMMWRDELERELNGNSDMPASLRNGIKKSLNDYKARIARLTSDPKTGEGLDELFQRAKALEKVRDAALKRDPYFDFGLAFLQIAIVMASVAIVTGGGLAIAVSVALGAIGTTFMVNGFFLLPGLTRALNAVVG